MMDNQSKSWTLTEHRGLRCYVIQCNDSVMKVVLCNRMAGAKAVLQELANNDFERQKHHWLSEWQRDGGVRFKRTGYSYYRHRLYWHIDEVPLVTLTEVASG